MTKFWDISEPIEESTATFPGDTPFSREWVARMEGGASCHVGTHCDAPLHFDVDGDDIASVDLNHYMGRCRVVQVQGEGTPRQIPASALTNELLDGVERILFRTQTQHDHQHFDSSFTAVGPEAAERLAAAGIRLVGIDTPSMDHATCKDLHGHNVLYRAGIAILENIDLSVVPVGDYELIALPLRIRGSDSSPVRAILRELDRP